jgi:hypothetical protein
VVEQTGVDIELGALGSRLAKHGVVLRRSATRLVVRFDGETTLARIQPHLLRIVGPGEQPPALTRTGRP